MGRYETAAEFYRFREPYPPTFFQEVAARLSLNRSTRLLDVACGPGNLAIGFAPFVGPCTAIDPEAAMLDAASSAAEQAGVDVTFILTALKDFDCAETCFDFVTIGRAIHWLSQDAALGILERVLSAQGRIAVCAAITSDAPLNTWAEKFRQVRKAWTPAEEESRYRIDMERWFAPSRFRKQHEIAVLYRQQVSILELMRRALSYSVTSPAALGEKRAQFEAEVEAAVEPFAKRGVIEEEVIAKATVFA